MHEPPAEPHSAAREQPAARRLAWRRLGRLCQSDVCRLVVFALSVRLCSAALAFYANVVFPLAEREQFTVFRRTHLFWDAFARYDSGWFFDIARNWYQYVEGGRNNLAFFPVYPFLMRQVGQLLGGGQANYYLAGIVISWTAFTVAMVLLYRLARLDLPRDGAWRAVVYAAIFPFAFFFGLVYSESVFLMFTVAAFYGFRTRRWVMGGMAGALAAATRVNGVMALPALAWIAWQQTKDRPPERAWAALALCLVVGGLATWSAYVYTLSGSYLEWMHSIRRWDYHPGGMPLQPVLTMLHLVVTQPYQYLTSEPMGPYDLLNGAAAVALLLAVPLVWRRLGAGYALFMIANLWLPLSSGSLLGLGRYGAVLFPFAIVLATFRSEASRTTILVVSAALYMLCLALFTNIHPIF
jgi:hypothetical protein